MRGRFCRRHRHRSTCERGEEAVQGAQRDWDGLPQRFVEQVVCVLGAERPGADALCGCGKGGGRNQEREGRNVGLVVEDEPRRRGQKRDIGGMVGEWRRRVRDIGEVEEERWRRRIRQVGVMFNAPANYSKTLN